MDSTSTTTAAAATAKPTGDASSMTTPSSLLEGIDIAQVLRSEGPIVTCVLLRATSANNDNDIDSKHAADNSNNNATSIEHLVEEIQMDTTPKKNQVATILGGPFSFVGQYEEEGIVLMARRGWILDYENVDDNDDNQLPPQGATLNPHKLQPPFDTLQIYGDILVLKVAEVEDPLDNNDDEQGLQTAPNPVVSNDEFFLDYNKESYLTFAARTDVVPPTIPAAALGDNEKQHGTCDDNDDDYEDNGNESEPDEWSGQDDDEDNDEEEDEEEFSEQDGKSAMMNLVLSTVLRKFQEENGRGPSTEELLVLKMTIAHKLGMEVSSTASNMEEQEESSDDDENNPEQDRSEDDKEDGKEPSSQDNEDDECVEENHKRSSEDAALETEPTAKKVKFGLEETGERAKAIVVQ